MTQPRKKIDHPHGWVRLMNFFDGDDTAGEFLSVYGDSGFVGAVQRMAREIERLRAAPPETDSDMWRPIETAPKDGTWIVIGKTGWDLFPKARWRVGGGEDEPNGWLFADDTTPCVVSNIDGEGFLGWQEDVDDGNMPDFWAPIPPEGGVT